MTDCRIVIQAATGLIFPVQRQSPDLQAKCSDVHIAITEIGSSGHQRFAGKRLHLFFKSFHMKTLFLFASILLSTVVFAQTTEKKSAPDPNKKTMIVEASCGQCKFELAGKGCDLAVRINGKAYFVDGTEIDSHGDAHADDGFCNAIRKAEVQGEVVKDKFKVTYFSLLKEEPKKN